MNAEHQIAFLYLIRLKKIAAMGEIGNEGNGYVGGGSSDIRVFWER